MDVRFGTDGIRGVANRDLTPELVLALGRAAARVLGADEPFVVGRDTRRSGPMLEAALVAGLSAEGADVRLVGVLPTPAVAQLAHDLDAPGAMLTASHNPFSDNGVKLFAPGGHKLTDPEQAAVETEWRAVLGTAPVGPEAGGVGIVAEARGALDDYAAHVVDALDGRRLDGVRVVVDCANGATFRAAPRVLRELGAQVEVLHASPDGANINEGCGSIDPSDLRHAVRATGAAAGLAFDGDGDRLIAVDERGEIVDGDQLLAIAAFDRLEQGRLRNDAVVVTTMANGGLRRCLRAAGIGIVEVDVGDRNVLDALARHDLVLGGEQSGHLIHADLATTGDGILAGALLLDVLRSTEQPLSALAGIVRRMPQVLRSVPVVDRGAVAGDPALAALVEDVAAGLGDGRVLVRPSGTEPVVRVMVEADDEAAAGAAADRLAAAVAAVGGAPGR